VDRITVASERGPYQVVVGHGLLARLGELLDLAGLPALFQFPLDMARVPAEVNRLSNQVLVQTFEEEWGKVHE